MSHCPQCGELTPEGARVCPFCGTVLVQAPPRSSHAGSRTMMGVAPVDTSLPVKPMAAERPPRASATLVGMPLASLPLAAKAPEGASPSPHAAARSGLPSASATLVGLARPELMPVAPQAAPKPATAPGPAQSPSTMAKGHGAPGTARGLDPQAELGATMAKAVRPQVPVQPSRPSSRASGLDRRRYGGDSVRPNHRGSREKARDAVSKRSLAMILAAGALAFVAVGIALFWPNPAPLPAGRALFWPTPAPLAARAYADADGHEGIELTCKSCPDGTTLTVNDASTKMIGGRAILTLPSPLLVGENRLKVRIDRPGRGRDETVRVTLNVAYRIRADITTLQAERPAFQVVAEAARGTTVAIDGRELAFAAGRAVENIDVTAACAGLAADVKTLSKQVPFVATPEGGAAERGVVTVSVGIVPLVLDAPVTPPQDTSLGALPAQVVIDGPSFLLAGRTVKGAEIVAAGKPIPVDADGAFAQPMNVSAVGTTQIEVRAKLSGMAPRIGTVRVRRVESLDKAAQEFMASESPVGYAELGSGFRTMVGKPIALYGEIGDVKKLGRQTVMLLDAQPCGSGSICTVRVVRAGDSTEKRGDGITVFGRVGRPFALPGRGEIPEVLVDFALKGPISVVPSGRGSRDPKPRDLR